MTVWTAKGAAGAMTVLASVHIDAALIDWRLGALEDGVALGRALQRDHGIPFVLFSGFWNTESTGHGYKQGATDIIDKPLDPLRLRAAMELAIEKRRGIHDGAGSDRPIYYGADSVSERWAALVMRSCRAGKDPSTEADVAKACGVSTSGFRRICSGCCVGAKDTRDMVRFLRALSRAREDGSTLASHLAISDPRTRARLFERAGLPVDSRFVPLRLFILRQRFVPDSKECLRELAHRAANDSLFLIERS